jgi:hypothetical protein
MNIKAQWKRGSIEVKDILELGLDVVTKKGVKLGMVFGLGFLVQHGSFGSQDTSCGQSVTEWGL